MPSLPLSLLCVALLCSLLLLLVPSSPRISPVKQAVRTMRENPPVFLEDEREEIRGRRMGETERWKNDRQYRTPAHAVIPESHRLRALLGGGVTTTRQSPPPQQATLLGTLRETFGEKLRRTEEGEDDGVLTGENTEQLKIFVNWRNFAPETAKA